MEGGDNADTIYGDGGADEIHGDDGDDVLEGGAGNDAIYGGDGADILRGQDGDDDLWGENGADVLCGGASGSGADHLSGAFEFALELIDAADKLWEPSASNTPTGASQANDDCGHTSHGSSWAGGACDYALSTRPSECPA